MYGRWMLVRDLPVFHEHELPNLRFFTDDSAGALADEVLKLRQLAEMQSPPAVKLMSWSQCAEHLIREIGFSTLRPVSTDNFRSPDNRQFHACAKRPAIA
jgi:hypothetical protein